MTPDTAQILALFIYFLGVALCFVRYAQGDRLHMASASWLLDCGSGFWLLSRDRGL